MGRPTIKIYTLSWREIELWAYRKLVKWKICKLPVTHEISDKSKALMTRENAWMASVNNLPIDFEHRDRVTKIGGPVKLRNFGEEDVILEGPLLKIKLASRDSILIMSPILEMVEDGHGKMMLREWDARHVVSDMLAEYARSFKPGVVMSQEQALDLAREKFHLVFQERE